MLLDFNITSFHPLHLFFAPVFYFALPWVWAFLFSTLPHYLLIHFHLLKNIFSCCSGVHNMHLWLITVHLPTILCHVISSERNLQRWISMSTIPFFVLFLSCILLKICYKTLFLFLLQVVNYFIFTLNFSISSDFYFFVLAQIIILYYTLSVWSFFFLFLYGYYSSGVQTMDYLSFYLSEKFFTSILGKTFHW